MTSNADDLFADILDAAPAADITAPADLPRTAPDRSVRYLCEIAGIEWGPLSLEELRGLADDGQLAPADRVRRIPGNASTATVPTSPAPTGHEWICASDLPELTFDENSGSDPVAAVEPTPAMSDAANDSPPEQPEFVQPDLDDLDQLIDATEFDEASIGELLSESSPDDNDPAETGPANRSTTATNPAKVSPAKAEPPHKPATSAISENVPAADARNSQAVETRTASALTTASPTGTAPAGGRHASALLNAISNAAGDDPEEAKRGGGGFSFSVSPTLLAVLGILAVVAVWMNLPASARGTAGTVTIDQTPLPIGSVTLQASDPQQKVMTLSVADGAFQSADDRSLPAGSYEVELLVGNALGMEVPQLNASPLAKLNGARFKTTLTIEPDASAGLELQFSSSAAQMPAAKAAGISDK